MVSLTYHLDVYIELKLLVPRKAGNLAVDKAFLTEKFRAILSIVFSLIPIQWRCILSRKRNYSCGHKTFYLFKASLNPLDSKIIDGKINIIK